MIGRLRGTVVERDHAGSGSEVLIEIGDAAGGLGYRVTTTPATAAGLERDQQVILHIHHHFWEADQRLFGFLTKDERIAFEGLLGAHKVGPALALAIIATFPPTDLARVLADDDLDALCTVPGVGKKTAQRLLVDLKSSLVLPVLDAEAATPAGRVSRPANTVEGDIREALAALGYQPSEVEDAMARSELDGLDAGAGLKVALRSLAEG